jgi:hypothetical protein
LVGAWRRNQRLGLLCVLAIVGGLPLALAPAARATTPTSIPKGWIFMPSVSHRPHRLTHRLPVRQDRAHIAIVGGTQISIERTPWQVALLGEIPVEIEGKKGVLYELCGGVIIGESRVLTAAHCATLELPGSRDHGAASRLEDQGRHDTGVLAVLSEHAAAQPWWLGYLDTGDADIVFQDAPKVTMYAHWKYVLIEAGPEQACVWRGRGWKGVLPDLMFPTDRSWLLSTLWDDDWTCIGGSRGLVDSFLAHPDLRHRTREVDPSVKDATPPGHIAF